MNSRRPDGTGDQGSDLVGLLLMVGLLEFGDLLLRVPNGSGQAMIDRLASGRVNPMKNLAMTRFSGPMIDPVGAVRSTERGAVADRRS